MKNNLKGAMSVFAFSFTQTVKSKVFIVTTLLSIAIMIVCSVATSEESGIVGANKGNIKKLVINDSVPLPQEMYEGLKKDYKDLEISFTEKTVEDFEEEAVDNEEYNDTVVAFVNFNHYFDIQLYKNNSSDIGEIEMNQFADTFEEVFNDMKNANCNLTEEQKKLIDMPVSTKVTLISEEKDINNDSQAEASKFMFVIIVFMLLVMCGENIGTAIVTEKSSRVMEYILTSIKPLALVIGKVCSAVAATSIQIAAIVAGCTISNMYSKGSSDAVNAAANLSIGSLKIEGSPAEILLGVLVMIAGLAIFALLSCLVASTASKIEELAEVNRVYTFLVMAGYFGGFYFFTFGSGLSNAIKNVFYLIPITSVFVLPIDLLTGKAGIMIGALSVAVMLATLWLLFMFVSKVYETLILYNGQKIGFKQLVGIYKQNK
ncbi:MAG: ABC transporter permease [Lachnospiraceae bacterium]|nr:ABC transporter permease [Lachnospiraceae bacterium]